MFEVRNIAFSYGTKRVLQDVSFATSQGEVVCIVGDNGAGKTTLLKILSTVMEPDAGVVRLDGTDVLNSPESYRRRLGFLQERPALYEDMSVKAYLTYRARLKGEPDKRIRRRLSEAAQICMLKDIMACRICNLSIGLKKRVALADAILLRPRVIFLDDVLSGLDRSMRTSMGEIITSLSHFSSVILTGHEIDDFAKWVNSFLVLKSGSITSTIKTAGLDTAAVVARVDVALKGGAK